MNFISQSITSSVNCAITFGGQPIGGLQDISFTENFSVKQINTLGRAYSNAFISGFFNGEFRAKKVFLDQDLFDLALTSALIHDSTASISTTNIENSTSNPNTDQQVNEFFKYTTKNKNYDNIMYSIYYDVQIYNENNESIAIIKNCILDQRTTSMSISNLIIMEDVVFKFQSIEKNYRGHE